MIISIDYFSSSDDDHNSNQGTTITMLMIWTKSPVVMRPSCRYMYHEADSDDCDHDADPDDGDHHEDADLDDDDHHDAEDHHNDH